MSETLLMLLWKECPDGYVLIARDGSNLMLQSKGTERDELLRHIQAHTQKEIDQYIQDSGNTLEPQDIDP